MVVTTVGPSFLNERKKASRHLQRRAATIAILNIGGRGLKKQRPSIGIDQGMALAAFDLLARIVTARTAAFRGPEAWLSMMAALGPASRPMLAIRHDQLVIHLLEDGFIAQAGAPAIDRLPWRKVFRQQPPRDPAAQDIEDRVDDLAHRPFARPSSRFNLGRSLSTYMLSRKILLKKLS